MGGEEEEGIAGGRGGGGAGEGEEFGEEMIVGEWAV